ncbi:DUF6886 family protein [Bacillus sp. 1P06AnD]|uniref:DUF6886 family protein n=1 Tax=Bacillus sp. 1P06AnD TaxID=3132208 RepID=UPI00399F664C
MRLFHVSEENDIQIFHPRKPSRTDLDPTIPLVWAINEECLPNFLTPRHCPRVCYHIGPNTTVDDSERHFSATTNTHVVMIEHNWFQIMKETTLYLYEFNPKQFSLLDADAGYYTSMHTQVPIAKTAITDLFNAHFERGVEVRVVDHLWDAYDSIQKTTFRWSMCKMANAKPRTA